MNENVSNCQIIYHQKQDEFIKLIEETLSVPSPRMIQPLSYFFEQDILNAENVVSIPEVRNMRLRLDVGAASANELLWTYWQCADGTYHDAVRTTTRADEIFGLTKNITRRKMLENRRKRYFLNTAKKNIWCTLIPTATHLNVEGVTDNKNGTRLSVLRDNGRPSAPMEVTLLRVPVPSTDMSIQQPADEVLAHDAPIATITDTAIGEANVFARSLPRVRSGSLIEIYQPSELQQPQITPTPISPGVGLSPPMTPTVEQEFRPYSQVQQASEGRLINIDDVDPSLQQGDQIIECLPTGTDAGNATILADQNCPEATISVVNGEIGENVPMATMNNAPVAPGEALPGPEGTTSIPTPVPELDIDLSPIQRIRRISRLIIDENTKLKGFTHPAGYAPKCLPSTRMAFMINQAIAKRGTFIELIDKPAYNSVSLTSRVLGKFHSKLRWKRSVVQEFSDSDIEKLFFEDGEGDGNREMQPISGFQPIQPPPASLIPADWDASTKVDIPETVVVFEQQVGLQPELAQQIGTSDIFFPQADPPLLETAPCGLQQDGPQELTAVALPPQQLVPIEDSLLTTNNSNLKSLPSAQADSFGISNLPQPIGPSLSEISILLTSAAQRRGNHQYDLGATSNIPHITVDETFPPRLQEQLMPQTGFAHLVDISSVPTNGRIPVTSTPIAEPPLAPMVTSGHQTRRLQGFSFPVENEAILSPIVVANEKWGDAKFVKRRLEELWKTSGMVTLQTLVGEESHKSNIVLIMKTLLRLNNQWDVRFVLDCTRFLFTQFEGEEWIVI